MTDREKWARMQDEIDRQAAIIERLETTLIALVKETERLRALQPSGIRAVDRQPLNARERAIAANREDMQAVAPGIARMAAGMKLPMATH